ncbi:MAG: ATP-binding cassette domain-containing protein [Chitinophagales bacterium]|nr:ATP-binding cassette domain-containing protein [Hyphomicrobiales bacterium]
MKQQAPTAALDVAAVSHNYGDRKALDNVSLNVERGEFCALLGLNGAGKSTLFSLITRLFSSATGSVKILGYDVRRDSGEALRRIGVVFQSRTVDADLSVMQNMSYHAALHGISSRDGKMLALEALERVSLADKAHAKVKELSGGQVRRAEIARALIHRPKLLLLDEPTVGLDVGSRRDIAEQVRRLVQNDGLGVLWATHILEEIDGADKVVILHKGRVLESGTAKTIVEKSNAANLTAAFTQMTGGAGADANSGAPSP